MDTNYTTRILIKFAKQENTWAFKALMRRFEKDVFRFAYTFLGNAEDCQDIVQEVFTKVYFALSRYETGKAKFTTWLYTITRNHCLNHLKKNRVGDQQLEENMAKSSFENEVVLKNDLFLALAALPIAMREAFVLVAISGLSYEEAAKVMDTKPGTIKSRVHNSRMKLIKKMGFSPNKEMSLNEMR